MTLIIDPRTTRADLAAFLAIITREIETPTDAETSAGAKNATPLQKVRP